MRKNIELYRSSACWGGTESCNGCVICVTGELLTGQPSRKLTEIGLARKTTEMEREETTEE